MKRLDLVAFRNSLLTPDTAEAIRRVELRAAAVGGVRLSFLGPNARGFTWETGRSDPGPTGMPPHASMRNTGREVRLRLHLIDPGGLSPEDVRRKEVEILWGAAVPCGLVPWTRYPLPGPGDDVFHHFGPWQPLYDSLLGEGRGELAWTSVCAAAQSDVGKWEGDRAVERFVQAQVHRLGIPCGAVDGVVGDRTQSALRALGVRGMRLEEVAAHLAQMTPSRAAAESRGHGYIIVGDIQANAVASGKVALMRTLQGYTVAVDGPGRVILDLGGDPEP